MKTFKTTISILSVVAMLMTTPALAGHPPKQPSPPPVKERPAVVNIKPSVTSGATSRSDADASATADQQQGQRQQQQQLQSSRSESSAVGDVDVGGDATRIRSTAIALSVPGATAAPAATGECLVHSRGWTFGMGFMGRSGGTELEDDCAQKQHCLALADRYAAAGMWQAMADQLKTCGGVSVQVIERDQIPPTTATPTDGSVSRAEYEEGMRQLRERQDRITERGLSK